MSNSLCLLNYKIPTRTAGAAADVAAAGACVSDVDCSVVFVAGAGASAAGGGAAAASAGGAGTNLTTISLDDHITILNTKTEYSRSSIQSNLPCRSTYHCRAIRTLLRLLTQFRVVRNLLRAHWIDNHHLSLLAMRAGSTIQEHGLRARDWHVERADIRLAVLERDVTTVHTTFHRCACFVSSRLSYRVVAVRKLIHYDVAYGSDDRVWDEGVLGTADDDGDYLVLAANGVR
jgi:hypothetical protein